MMQISALIVAVLAIHVFVVAVGSLVILHGGTKGQMKG